MIKNLRIPPSSKGKKHFQGKDIKDPMTESSKEDSKTKTNVLLGIPFIGFKKSMI